MKNVMLYCEYDLVKPQNEEFKWNTITKYFKPLEMDGQIGQIVENIINNFDKNKLIHRYEVLERDEYGHTSEDNYDYEYDNHTITVTLHHVGFRGGEAPSMNLWLMTFDGEQIRYKLSKKYIKKLFKFFEKEYKKHGEYIQAKAKSRRLMAWRKNKEFDPYQEEDWSK